MTYLLSYLYYNFDGGFFLTREESLWLIGYGICGIIIGITEGWTVFPAVNIYGVAPILAWIAGSVAVFIYLASVKIFWMHKKIKDLETIITLMQRSKKHSSFLFFNIQKPLPLLSKTLESVKAFPLVKKEVI